MSCCFPLKKKRQRNPESSAVAPNNGEDPNARFVIRGDVVLPTTEPSTPKCVNGLRPEDHPVGRAGSFNLLDSEPSKTEASIVSVVVENVSELRASSSRQESLSRIRANISELLGIPVRCVDVHHADKSEEMSVVFVPRPASHSWDRSKGKLNEAEGWINASQTAQRLEDASLSNEMNELFRRMRSSWPQQHESRTTTETGSINGILHTPKSPSGFTYKSPSPMLPPRYLGIGPLEYTHEHSIPGALGPVPSGDANGHASSMQAREGLHLPPKLPLKLINEKTPSTPDERKRSLLHYKPMTPRTERRKHMQGSSVALRGQQARSQIRPDAPAGWTSSPVVAVTTGEHEGGEKREDESELRRANGEVAEDYNQFSQWMSPKAKDWNSILRTPPKPQAREDAAAGHVGRVICCYVAAAFSNAEYGVTAMRGTAGWRRQLELAATRVPTSRDPSPIHGRVMLNPWGWLSHDDEAVAVWQDVAIDDGLDGSYHRVEAEEASLSLK
ncbi:hypothetical protein GUITHDRAFT_135698 [Guillardia theta CCMP2712]|uniref:Uncharacterized protein n=1 Tax=Guillardia theta (strain CCMP2712) TaxID=905079 RepID=L1JP03_GUITC|nr:hypothetical protein GUITHDRAFT_135698 [Guillardia theta CCMP2712]EKX50024.1 hypothetical protein GUITHDRAFT_135698 [Guillardia theta CCMP2712]|eukprot:XP_005837004.1 hypothetical protein GUITHDRAFT_135698 [Guillardia theta CCMP2712]